MLKTPQTDAVIQVVLQERSRQLTNGLDPVLPEQTIAIIEDWLLLTKQADSDAIRKRRLIKAAAFIVAELERIERVRAKAADADAYVNDRASGIYDD